MGDIDISNAYSRQQFLMLIYSNMRTQKTYIRQAKLIGNTYRQQTAEETLKRYKRLYNKVITIKEV